MATILVVDDDTAVARPLIKFLEFEGFTPIGAANGAEALAYFNGGGTAAAIVLDLRMPVMDGWTFRREQLKDPAIASIPVVVISGADQHRVDEVRAAASFEKPIQLRLVVAELRRLCHMNTSPASGT